MAQSTTALNAARIRAIAAQIGALSDQVAQMTADLALATTGMPTTDQLGWLLGAPPRCALALVDPSGTNGETLRHS